MLTAFLLTGMTAVARDSNTTRPAAVSNDCQRVSLFEETLWAASRAASPTAREGTSQGRKRREAGLSCGKTTCL